MERKTTRILSLLLGLFLTLSFAVSGRAATKTPETRTPIQTVSLNVSSSVKAGDESGYILATGTSDNYTIGNYEWGSTSEWKIGDQPKVKIYLHARDGYYFDKTTGKGKITVNGAEYSSGSIKDNKETLVVSIKLKHVGGTLEEPETVEWVGYPIGKAVWSTVPSANAYELALFYGDDQVYNVEKVTGTTYDFFPYMTKPGDYQFRVRAIPRDSEEASYMTSGDWVYSELTSISDEETPAYKYDWNTNTKSTIDSPKYGWYQNSTGWWYLETNGTYPKNTWKVIDGKWYLFDNDGYMMTGWQMRNGKKYYLSENGDMRTGWFQDGRIWYFLGGDGAAVTGWNNIGGKWYCMNAEGQMMTGWWLIDGKWYYLNDPSGEKLTDTYIGGHYLNGDGVWVP